MKSEPKPFASLSSGLLARKGAARPAMRPQGFSNMGAGLEDLGWNDMGFDPSKQPDLPEDEGSEDRASAIPVHPHNHAGLTPVDSPVHGQQAELAGRLSAYEPGDEGEDEDYDETAEPVDREGDAAAEPFEPEEEAVAEQFEAVEETAAEPEGADELVLEPQAAVEPEPAPEPVSLPVSKPVRTNGKARAVPGSKAKAAFTLRLDPERHLKLRLACAVGGRSAQQLVTEAVDALLGGIPELDSLAAKAKRKG